MNKIKWYGFYDYRRYGMEGNLKKKNEWLRNYSKESFTTLTRYVMLKVVIKTVINFIKVRNMKYLSDYMPQFPVVHIVFRFCIKLF